MKVKIGKDFKWEMSHRLTFHKGPCINIHGHSYKMRIEIEGSLNENQMIMDFYDVFAIVQPYVDKLDHSFIVDGKDDLMLNFLKENNFKHFVIPNFTTSEFMCIHFAEVFRPEFAKFDNLDLIRVRIYETEDAFAEVEVSLK